MTAAPWTQAMSSSSQGMMSRWGSCSNRGAVTMSRSVSSWRLLQASIGLLLLNLVTTYGLLPTQSGKLLIACLDRIPTDGVGIRFRAEMTAPPLKLNATWTTLPPKAAPPPLPNPSRPGPTLQARTVSYHVTTEPPPNYEAHPNPCPVRVGPICPGWIERSGVAALFPS